MERKVIVVVIILLLALGNLLQFVLNYSNLHIDVVPDEDTAINIAKVVLVANYGQDHLSLSTSAGDLERTFEVTYNQVRRAWVVTSHIPEPPDESNIAAIMGLIPEVTIRKSDGRIMSIVFR